MGFTQFEGPTIGEICEGLQDVLDVPCWTIYQSHCTMRRLWAPATSESAKSGAWPESCYLRWEKLGRGISEESVAKVIDIGSLCVLPLQQRLTAKVVRGSGLRWMRMQAMQMLTEDVAIAGT